MPAPLKPLSAVDSISPAVQRAKEQLFRPFRWPFWWRMAVVALFAGEFGGYGFNFNVPAGGGGGGHTNKNFLAAFPQGDVFRNILPWIVVGALAVVILMFLLLYVHSVFRFILFDSVLTGRCSIRQSWRRRHDQGVRYFVWLIIFECLVLLAIFMVVGLPLLGLWRAGIFSNAGEHIGLLVLAIFFMLMAFLILVLASWAITTVVRDFLVPIMALEDLSVAQAWRNYQPTLAQQKASAAAYLGMKLLLAIMVGFAVGIVSMIAFLILLIPSAVYFMVAIGIMAAGKAGVVLGALLIALGAITLLVLMFGIAGSFSVPLAVFFQSYALYYLGSRYQRLGELLWPGTNQPLAFGS